MKTKYGVILLFILYLLIRLYFLFTFPPFTDESLYIRFGQLAIDNPAFRWAPLLYVARQPLAMWLFGIGAIALHHPLFGARMMVFLFNIPVFFALWAITKQLFSKRAAYFVVLLVAFNPLCIMTQTLAMMDGFLFAISCYILWLVIAKWQSHAFLRVLCIALLLAAALWIKSTALLLVLVSLIAISAKKPEHELSVPQLIVACLTCIIVPLVLLIPLFLQKNFSMVLHEPSSFVVSPASGSLLPAVWATNISSTIISLLYYFNPLVILAGLETILLITRRKNLILFMWFTLPLGITIATGKHLLVRYYIVGVAGLLPLLAFGLAAFTARFKWKPLSWIMTGVLVLQGIFFIMNPPVYFRLFPAVSGEQAYAISWPSGYGIPELTNWIDTHVPSDKIFILAVVDSPGNPTDYLLAYYYFRPNVRTIFATVTNEYEFKKLAPLTQKAPVYLATRGSLLIPAVQRFLKPVVEFQKPYHQDFIGLYRIEFPNN